MCSATRDARFVPEADIGFRGDQIIVYVVRSTPNLSDLIIDCAAKFLRYALNLLPRICAILAFETREHRLPKTGQGKRQNKRKIGACINLFPAARVAS
jgi:hypothetical protein